jgi:hypothetical protein
VELDDFEAPCFRQRALQSTCHEGAAGPGLRQADIGRRWGRAAPTRLSARRRHMSARGRQGWPREPARLSPLTAAPFCALADFSGTASRCGRRDCHVSGRRAPSRRGFAYREAPGPRHDRVRWSLRVASLADERGGAARTPTGEAQDRAPDRAPTQIDKSGKPRKTRATPEPSPAQIA